MQGKWNPERIERQILSVTARVTPFLLPELPMRLITPASPWWTLAPADLEEAGIPEPFWGFAWAGGQVLARFLLDHPEWVRGKRVLDFGTGCGILALAALKAGAAQVRATEIDPWAILAARENLRAYADRLQLECGDCIGQALPPGTVLLCGDMHYDASLSERMQAWFASLSDCTILVGDPQRGFLRSEAFTRVASYQAPADCDGDGRLLRPADVLLFNTL